MYNVRACPLQMLFETIGPEGEDTFCVRSPSGLVLLLKFLLYVRYSYFSGATRVIHISTEILENARFYYYFYRLLLQRSHSLLDAAARGRYLSADVWWPFPSPNRYI